MRCEKCGKEFEENDIQESHDVPCYLFWDPTRRERKQRADKFGRHWLCEKCHDDYENNLNMILKLRAMEFSKEFFGEDGE